MSLTNRNVLCVLKWVKKAETLILILWKKQSKGISQMDNLGEKQVSGLCDLYHFLRKRLKKEEKDTEQTKVDEKE